MYERESRKSRSRLLAALLSFLLPGAGQLYLGRAARGLLLLAAALIDVAAIVHYAGTGGGRHLLLIVYLGLALPVIYFYSMFDVLQAPAAGGPDGAAEAEVSAEGLSALTGAAVAGAGLLLLLLIKPPAGAGQALALAGDYAASAGLVALSALLLWRRSAREYRIGRATAALAVLAVGCLLLWDRLHGTNGIAVLAGWWPVPLVVLGLEIMLADRIRRRRAAYGGGQSGRPVRRFPFDAGGLAAALVIAVVTYSVTQLAGLPFKWIEGLNAGLAPPKTGMTDESGFRYRKPEVGVELARETRRIEIENPNGAIVVRQGAGTALTVDATVWVDLPDKAEADQVAGASLVSVSGDEKLTIAAKGEHYEAADGSGKRIPRINLVVTLPRPIEPEPERAPGIPGGQPRGGEAAGPGDAGAMPDGAEGQPNSGAGVPSGTGAAGPQPNAGGGAPNGAGAAAQPDGGGGEAGEGEAGPEASGTDGAPSDSGAVRQPADGGGLSGGSDAGRGAAGSSGAPSGARAAERPVGGGLADAAESGLPGGRAGTGPGTGGAGSAAPVSPLSPDGTDGTAADVPSLVGPAGNTEIEVDPGGDGGGADEQPVGVQSLAVAAGNGDVEVDGLTLPEGLTVTNTDGHIDVRRLNGKVRGETKNGTVTAREITGAVRLRTFNGDIVAGQIGGDAVVETSNGSITLEAMQGNVEAGTENGGITASELAASLHASTLNGRIEIRSSVVGGSWDVGSSVGEIRLHLPEDGDYTVSGSVTFGTIESDLLLEIGEKVVRGRVGEGTYRIAIDANNSIYLLALRPPSN